MRRPPKIVVIVFAIVLPLLAAAWIGPRFLDVEAYKPALVEAVRQATGRELVIEGPLKLTLLPVPRVSARKVHFANAVGGTGAQMVEVQWVGASPSWSALLQGRVEVGKLTLYKPVRWIVPYPADACLAADFGRLMDAEGAKWAAAVKASGASLE